jgi:hypothetical protein
MVGTLLGASWSRAQPMGHGAHPPLPGQQFYVQCRFNAGGETKLVEVPLKLVSPAMAAELDQTVALPAPLPPLHLKQYLPQAVLEQDVVPAERPDAVLAVQVSIDGPKQSYQRWLVANDNARNRLTSLIGTWRYMSVADQRQRDELFTQFEDELTRAPKLLVSRADGTGACRLSAEVGDVHRVDALDCTLRVLKFYAHFGLDPGTGEPIDQSEQRLNPAVLVEIESAGKKEERWVFAKFAGFQMQKETLPYRIGLDCALAQTRSTPDFAIVTVGGTTHEVWTRQAGKSVSKQVRLDEAIEVAGSRYTFHLARFVPSGRLVEQYRAQSGQGATAALRLETADADGSRASVWLALGKEQMISTAQGPLAVSFGPRQASMPVNHSGIP